MPFQELQPRPPSQTSAPQSALDQPAATFRDNAPLRTGIRSLISRNVQPAGTATERYNRGRDFTREELTSHAVTVVDGWSERLKTLQPGSQEYLTLVKNRDLVTRALLAADAYSDVSKTGVSIPSHIVRYDGDKAQFILGPDFDVKLLHNKRNGYHAHLYRDLSSNTFLIVNRGTSDIPDWANNLQQAAGLPAGQYEQAVALAYNVKSAVDKEYGSIASIEFIGHSLGGGLASLQAVVLEDCRATTFNAAGLHRKTAADFNTKLSEQSARNVTAYRIQGDILSTIQGDLSDIFRGSFVPEAIGAAVEIQPPRPLPFGRPFVATAEAFDRHGMNAVLLQVLREAGVEPQR